MSAVIPADSTYAQIEITVRRLTASPSQSQLTSATIQQYVNTFYNADFPYGIKVDQMRDVYTFYTEPYRDRYPLDVNYNQGVRAPVYVDGIQGNLSKDRMQFFAVWPKFPTSFQPATGDGTTQSFSFTLGSSPILSKTVILGCEDTGGFPITVADDGNGNMQYNFPNPVTSVPAQNLNPPVGGMYNLNNGNPGLNTVVNIGTVNYVTSAISVNFALVGITPASASTFRVRANQYSTGRPYSVLFWNNEFTIRPIPKYIHQIEVETYLSPVQFMLTTDNPILNQWSQYIAIGAALKILRDRQDMEGYQNLLPFFKEQEALVLERQGVEEIGQRNSTVFSGSTPSNYGGWQGFWGGGWF